MALAVILAPLGAEDTAENWTEEKALEEIRALIHSRVARSELSERRDAIKAWLERVEEHDMKLGEQGFVVGIAQHMADDSRAAHRTIVDYLKRYRDVPASDYRWQLARLLLSTAATAARSRDFATVELTLPIALRLAINKKLVYHRLGGALRRAGGAEAHRLLNALVRHVLDEPEFNDTEKQQVLEGIYGRATTSRALQPDASRSRARAPRPLRPFSATDIDGRKLSLADYRGKVVLVDFWATWSGPCLLEMPNTARVYRKYHDRGFEIIGISLDRPGDESRLRTVMKRFGMDWRQIYDGKEWNAEIAVQNGVRRLPTRYLLDRGGEVRYTDLRGRELGEKVAELLKETEE